MKWVDKPGVLTYLIDSYAGLDGSKRQFIWEDADGNIVLGNTRAFSDHLAEKFHLKTTETKWMEIHAVLPEPRRDRQRTREAVEVARSKVRQPTTEEPDHSPQALKLGSDERRLPFVPSDIQGRTMPLTKLEIQEAVKDPAWQGFRSTLHGLSLCETVSRLAEWKQEHPTRKAQVQIENYINALRRAGEQVEVESVH